MKILAGVIAALLALNGWQFIQIAGYKVASAECAETVAELNAAVGIAQANNVAIAQALATQNAGIEAMAQETAKKKAAALAARDKALADLKSMQGDYARLRKSWPQDCVSAVTEARRELGL